jgi:hypothetical protein
VVLADGLQERTSLHPALVLQQSLEASAIVVFAVGVPSSLDIKLSVSVCLRLKTNLNSTNGLPRKETLKTGLSMSHLLVTQRVTSAKMVFRLPTGGIGATGRYCLVYVAFNDNTIS